MHARLHVGGSGYVRMFWKHSQPEGYCFAAYQPTGTIPYFTLRNLCKAAGKEEVSSCQVSTLHLARRPANRMQRTMPYQSSSKSGRRASSSVQKSRLNA